METILNLREAANQNIQVYCDILQEDFKTVKSRLIEQVENELDLFESDPLNFFRLLYNKSLNIENLLP